MSRLGHGSGCRGVTHRGRRVAFLSLEALRGTSGGYRAGAHLFPFRTEKLSPAAPMILRPRGKVGRRPPLTKSQD